MQTFFAQPDRLGLLVPWLLLAGWAAWGGRRRTAAWGALGQPGRPPGTRAGWRWVAAGLVIVALAQPRWGRWVEPWALPGRDLVIVVDVSRSMAAEDAVPNRLGVAVASASSLIRAAESRGGGDRFAVVAFAGRAVVRCPLIFQATAALQALGSLRPGEVEPGGTDLGAAVDVALGVFDAEDHEGGRAVFAFSDGEDFAGGVGPAASRAQAAGVVIHAVAIGDPDRGHRIPVVGPNHPSLTYQGKPVATRRADPPLDTLRQTTGGTLIRLGLEARDLGPIFRDAIGGLAARVRQARNLAPRSERAGWFALAALVALGLGSRPGRVGGYLPVARFGLVLGVAGLAGLGAGNPAATDRAADHVTRGRALYESGRFADALVEFDHASELAPGAPVPVYDAAAARYRLGQFDRAALLYDRARDLAPPILKVKADYGLGNARLAAGDLTGAIAAYDRCVEATVTDPAARAVQDDARANRQFAIRRRDGTPPPGDPGPNPNPRRSPNRRNNDPNGSGQRSSDPGPAPGQNGEGGNSSAPPGGTRGSGGQGGEGAAPPESDSPAARLDAALRAVQANREVRPPDEPNPSRNTSGGRDW